MTFPRPFQAIEHEGTYQVYAADGAFVAQFGLRFSGEPPPEDLKEMVDLFLHVANKQP